MQSQTGIKTLGWMVGFDLRCEIKHTVQRSLVYFVVNPLRGSVFGGVVQDAVLMIKRLTRVRIE